MKAIHKHWIKALVGCIFFLSAGLAVADDGMTVVANPYNQNKSQRWIDLLVTNEVSVEFVVPQEFDKVKTKKYITIIGGVDDEAVKKVIEAIVGAAEAKAMAQKGASKMFVKEGYGSKEQKILIFTGSDSDAAAMARIENKDAWMPLLQKWFGLDDGPGTLKSY